MAYNYYHNVPGWGTSQFQFGPPPTPTFQPQPSWGGLDFYRAHAANADPYLYDHAWRRARELRDPSTGFGVGIHEARHWHRRAYGGMIEARYMSPAEIGHAAAYEAYRTWLHNSSIYEPLSGDLERQREGLIGLAIAEATRLLQSVGRSFDTYGRMDATDAAAATASIIFFQSREGEDPYYSRSRSRSGSYSGSSYGEPYTYDDSLMLPGSSRHRSYSRPRSHSRHRSHSGSSMHVPAVVQYASSSSAIPVPHANVAYGGSYDGHYGGYSPSHGGHLQYGSQPLLAVPVSQSGVPVVVSSSGKSHKHRHSHSHSHSSSGRSRSSDPTLRIEYPGYSASRY